MNVNQLTAAIAKTRQDLTDTHAQLEREKAEVVALEEQRQDFMRLSGLGASAALDRRYLARFGHHSLPPSEKPVEIIQVEEKLSSKIQITEGLQRTCNAYDAEIEQLEQMYHELSTSLGNSLGDRALKKAGYNALRFAR